MKPEEVRQEITKVTALLLEVGLVIESNPAIERKAPQKTQITWSTAPKFFSGIPHSQFASIGEYRKCIEDKQYNFLLYDGSFVQATYMFSHAKLIQHRLLFYPCPVRLGKEDISQDFSVADAVDKYIYDAINNLEWLESQEDFDINNEDTQEYPRLHMKAPIRFDFDLYAQNQDHPASHLHMLNAECRIPVYGPLSFAQFLTFIIKSFYKSIWIENAEIRNFPIHHIGNRTITRSEEYEVHINSKTGWF